MNNRREFLASCAGAAGLVLSGGASGLASPLAGPAIQRITDFVVQHRAAPKVEVLIRSTLFAAGPNGENMPHWSTMRYDPEVLDDWIATELNGDIRNMIGKQLELTVGDCKWDGVIDEVTCTTLAAFEEIQDGH